MATKADLRKLIDWRSIRGRTIAFSAAISLPLLCLCAWLAFQLADANRRLIERVRDDLATQASGQIDQVINHSFGMLAGLAGSHDLITGQVDEFRTHARELLNLPNIQSIWAFDPTGKIAASVGLDPPIAKFGTEFQRLYTDVFQNKRTVSRVVGDGIQNATIIIAMPVIGDSAPKLGLAAQIHVQALSEVFTEAGMPTDWAAAVVDRHGHYVARSLDAIRRVGQKARPELVNVAQVAESKGVFENVTYEGVKVMNAFVRSRLTDWTTIVAVPVDNLNAPLYRNLLVVFLGGTLGLGAMLVAAFAMSQTISVPVRNLAAYANSISTGNLPPRSRFRISELEEVHSAFERSINESAHLAALVASSADAILSTDLNGQIRTWNHSAEQLFGIPADEAVGKHKSIIVPPNKRDEFERHRTLVLKGNHVSEETQRVARDGTRIEVSLSLAPIRQPNGLIVGTSSIIRDIRERKSVERHVQLLMHEVAHRSKNQLAVVQAIASQTARSSSDLDGFLTDFRARLRGMAVATDLLIERDWSRAPLKELVEQMLHAFCANGEQICIDGPKVMLDAKATEAFGLAIHELATNAVKYGAWSKQSGSIKADWAVEPDDSVRTLRFTWRESGCTSTQPDKKGFGTIVLEKMVPTMLGGRAQLEYNNEGFTWTLTSPVPETWSVIDAS